jgi:hypothetical protein
MGIHNDPVLATGDQLIVLSAAGPSGKHLHIADESEQ